VIVSEQNDQHYEEIQVSSQVSSLVQRTVLAARAAAGFCQTKICLRSIPTG
jgi:hypothetical protein